jgi:hypothetical protein
VSGLALIIVTLLVYPYCTSGNVPKWQEIRPGVYLNTPQCISNRRGVLKSTAQYWSDLSLFLFSCLLHFTSYDKICSQLTEMLRHWLCGKCLHESDSNLESKGNFNVLRRGAANSVAITLYNTQYLKKMCRMHVSL